VNDPGAGITRKWAATHGTYLAGRAYVDEADAAAVAMEAQVGRGRLRLLVGPDLREKFDRQRLLFNRAIWHGQDIEEVKRESLRMVKAWRRSTGGERGGARPTERLEWVHHRNASCLTARSPLSSPITALRRPTRRWAPDPGLPADPRSEGCWRASLRLQKSKPHSPARR
jgi:hypothetical protein